MGGITLDFPNEDEVMVVPWHVSFVYYTATLLYAFLYIVIFHFSHNTVLEVS